MQPTPAQTIDISSAEAGLPPAAGGTNLVGTKDFVFDVTAEKPPAGVRGDRRRGRRRLRLVPLQGLWAATSGWTGALKIFGSVPGTEVVVPAGVESWTVTCERVDGTVVGTEQIVVDRGQRKTITACGAATRKTKGPKRPR